MNFRASQDAVSPPSRQFVEDVPGHRKRTARQVRHASRASLRRLAGDKTALEDADVLCPTGSHDLGRKTGGRPKAGPKPGRRAGFKVWKTPFWKRRNSLRHERNAEARRQADAA